MVPDNDGCPVNGAPQAIAGIESIALKQFRHLPEVGGSR